MEWGSEIRDLGFGDGGLGVLRFKECMVQGVRDKSWAEGLVRDWGQGFWPGIGE